MDNRIVYLTGKQRMEAHVETIGPLKEDSVLVKVEHVGICGSDVGFYETGMVGPDPVPFPIVLGHECAGTVVEVGPKVKKLKAGDTVCLEPGVPCGTCAYCRTGRYNLCQSVDFMAAPPFAHGALKQYVTHPESFTWKLPENLDTLDGAMMEPFSVGYHAAERGEAQYGKKIVILGAGCIGLMTIMACRLMGAVDIAAVDLFPQRLEMAKKVGASAVAGPADGDAVEAIKQVFPQGADIVFETAGSAVTTRQAGSIVTPGGTICLVGMAHEEIPLDTFAWILNEVTIKSVFRYRNSYPKVIDAVAKGLVRPKDVVTDVFSFEETAEAFAASVHRKKDIVKAVIKV